MLSRLPLRIIYFGNLTAGGCSRDIERYSIYDLKNRVADSGQRPGVEIPVFVPYNEIGAF